MLIVDSDKADYIEKYKILIKQLEHQDKQIWGFLKFFTTINGFLITFLIAAMRFSNLQPAHFIIISIIGIIIELYWIEGGKRSKVYTNSIHNQLRSLERSNKMGNFDIFTRFSQDLDEKSWWKKGGVKDFLFSLFPLIMIIVWIWIIWYNFPLCLFKCY